MSAELHSIFPPRQMAGPSRTANAGRSNVSLLTEGAGYIKRAKKGKQGDLVEKIVFDDDKRKEFLTGFRKRKQAKIEERRQRAKKRDHEEHLAGRREARRDLKKRAEENVRQVRLAMGLSADPAGDIDEEYGNDASEYTGSSTKTKGEGAEDDDDDDEDGSEGESESEGEAEEFEGDDQLAVVTIQDDFEDELMGLKKKKKSADAGSAPIPLLPASSRKQTKKRLAQAKLPPVAQRKKLISTLDPGQAEPGKTNIKQISSDYRSFETKSERRKMRELEKARRKEKWDLAKDRRGGSSSRGGRGGGRGGSSARGGRGGKSGRGGKGSKKAQWGAI